ncbi:hypothetical protein J7L87_04490, partial [bacterium]|nr:hypothetical protein [bacterium]
FLIILLSFSIFTFPAGKEFKGEITPAENEKYFKEILPLIKNAKESIYVIMFLAGYYPEYPESPTNQIFSELIKAKKRGLRVEIILEQSDVPGYSNTTEKNLKTARFLSNNGISVYFDSPEKTTHSKLVIIDKKFVVIGSTNWTYYALTKNNETSVIIKSPELAKYFLRYYEKIKKECETKFIPRHRKH